MNCRLIISTTVVLVSISFFGLDLPFKLRTTNPAADYAVYAFFCFLLPISIVLLGCSTGKGWFRKLAVVVAILVGVPAGFVGVFTIDDAVYTHALGYDPSLKLLDEVDVGVYSYRLYRTNCGATCAFGLQLRKEQLLPFGMKLIQPTWSYYGAKDGSLTVLPRDIEISFEKEIVNVPQ